MGTSVWSVATIKIACAAGLRVANHVSKSNDPKFAKLLTAGALVLRRRETSLPAGTATADATAPKVMKRSKEAVFIVASSAKAWNGWSSDANRRCRQKLEGRRRSRWS